MLQIWGRVAAHGRVTHWVPAGRGRGPSAPGQVGAHAGHKQVFISRACLMAVSTRCGLPGPGVPGCFPRGVTQCRALDRVAWTPPGAQVQSRACPVFYREQERLRRVTGQCSGLQGLPPPEHGVNPKAKLN